MRNKHFNILRQYCENDVLFNHIKKVLSRFIYKFYTPKTLDLATEVGTRIKKTMIGQN